MLLVAEPWLKTLYCGPVACGKTTADNRTTVSGPNFF